MPLLRRGQGTGPLRGAITVPGDKSISHRALVLATLARGRSRLEGLNRGADVSATERALVALGVTIERDDDKGVAEVEGCGYEGLREPDDVVDAGNSGTTMRTLLGPCAAIEGITVLTGDASLRRRPMLRVVVPLRQMGAVIDGRQHADRPPLVVRGTSSLRGVEIRIPVASAQVKTALLLAGLAAEGTTVVTEPRRSRDHTERMLEAAGVEVRREGDSVSLDGGSRPQALDRRVPGDFSSAMYLIAAALLVPGSALTLERVGLNPTRTGALEVLAAMGAEVRLRTHGTDAGEPVGDVEVAASDLKATEIGPEAIPSLIDEIPVLAVLATQAHGRTVVRGAAELRVKESDRIDAIVKGLRGLGARVQETDDGIAIDGPCRLEGGAVDAYGDHRIALAFAIAGMVAADRVSIRGWSCVDTSFPEFVDLVALARGAQP